jgi:phosphoribosyl 1,2-cyclic phosphodiesterase
LAQAPYHPKIFTFVAYKGCMGLEFCSLSSGSSGNCYYLGNGFHGILIDAGISAGSIKKFLKEINISIQTIMGVLVTHNHTDHIRGLSILARRNHIPVFTSEKVWNSILTPPVKLSLSPDCVRKIPLQQRFHLSGFDIEAFPVNHDAPETLGFHICSENKKVTVVTDLGYICETAAPYIKAANMLIIESNYDNQMLMGGSYPAFLKVRIKSDHGHLDNYQTASFISEHIHPEMSHICLAHLSKNNNTPEKALQTIQAAMAEKGIRLNENARLMVLNRSCPSEMIRI